MATTDTTYLEDYGIDTADFSIFSDPGAFALSGGSVTLKAGATVEFTGTLNGKEIPAKAQLHAAQLVRVTEQSHMVGGDRETKIVSGVLRPVRMDVFLDFGKHGWKSLPDFLMDSVNAQLIADKQEPVSREVFAKTISNMGMPLIPLPDEGIDGNMSLLWQHFGANQDTINDIFNYLTDLGAEDAMPANPGRIQRVVAFKKGGVPVTELEINRSDRSMSSHAGRVITTETGTETIDGVGFLDFVDATVTSFRRSVANRRIWRSLEPKIEEMKAAAKPKTDEIAQLEAQVDVAKKISRGWMGNWGGAQRRIQVNPDGTATYLDIIDPTNANSGRIVLQPKGTDEPVEFSFWTNYQNQPANTGGGGEVDTTGGGEINDEPF